MKLTLTPLPLLLTFALGACTIQTGNPAPSDPEPAAPASSNSKGRSGDAPSTTSDTTSDTTSTTTTGETILPTEIAIYGTLRSGQQAIHQAAGDQVVSLVSVRGDRPSLIPKPALAYPDLFNGRQVTITSPAPGSCKADVKLTYNASDVSAQITGTDTTDSDCADWTDRIARGGLDATIDDAPWSNVPTGETRRVTVHLKIH